jgi:hypothetical protein
MTTDARLPATEQVFMPRTSCAPNRRSVAPVQVRTRAGLVRQERWLVQLDRQAEEQRKFASEVGQATPPRRFGRAEFR